MNATSTEAIANADAHLQNANLPTYSELLRALCEAERGLEGRYPWPINSKCSATEARKATIASIRPVLNKHWSATV